MGSGVGSGKGPASAAPAGQDTTAGDENGLAFGFDQAFERELKAVELRRRLMATEIGGKRYFTEGPRARVGADLTRGPSNRLPVQFNFAKDRADRREFLFAGPYSAGDPITEADSLNLTGLCMSGGGIRSAAVNLGVTQALDALTEGGRSDVLDSIDYLSTVSGGNYIGTSIAAGMMQPPDPSKPLPANRYPYESKTDGSETPETAHLRDYSSYLTPNGLSDVIANLLIVARGLVGNIIMLLGALLFLAMIQLMLTPTTDYLATPRSLLLLQSIAAYGAEWAFGLTFGLLVFAALVILQSWDWPCLLCAGKGEAAISKCGRICHAVIGLFGLALVILAALFLIASWLGGAWPAWAGGLVTSLAIMGLILMLMLVWTCLKRWLAYRSGLSRRERISPAMIALAGLGLLAAFVEWQPAILASMRAASAPAAQVAASGADWLTLLFGKLGQAGYVFGPAAAAMLALGSKLINVVKAATGDASVAGKTRRYLGKALLIFLGVSVPILLWITFLNLVHAGICVPRSGAMGGCAYDAPAWFATAGSALAPGSTPPEFPVIWLYFWGFLACLLVSSFFSPNANSLHQLYRDRLSRAFLLERGPMHGAPPPPPPANGDRHEEPDDYTFSSLKLESDRRTLKPSGAWAPYLLVNTAINLQADYLGQRGRNADTFTLGPIISGSDATGYVHTRDLESRHPRLTLASGLAISGAAASANMGGNTIPVITFSLAALNVRLGYWLPNPAKLEVFNPAPPAPNGKAVAPWNRWESGFGNWYFMRELFGRIGQKSRRIYLTDGGHIENLGLYELTKRRCRVVVCVDAEADQGMVFSSLVKAQLMMRVDHGVRIELPWPEIAAATRMAGEKAGTADESKLYGKSGPHVAVGRIIYREPTREAPHGVHGVLIYIKSSLTGDESDLLRDYKRRHGDFPHETTLDQFFSEEQFEAYRALGFHMAYGFFAGKHDAAVWIPEDRVKRAEFFEDVGNALSSIAVPEELINRIMARIHKRAENLDKAREPKAPRPVTVEIMPAVATMPVVLQPSLTPVTPTPVPKRARAATKKPKKAGKG